MNVEINGPVEFQGDILSAIGKRKGVIIDQDSTNDEVTFTCDVSLNDMFGFASELRSLTEVSKTTMESAYSDPEYTDNPL